MMSRSSSLFRFFVGVLLAWAVLWTAPHEWRTTSQAFADPPPGGGPDIAAYTAVMTSVQVSATGDDKDVGLFIRVDQKVGTGTYDARMGAGDKWCVTVEVLFNDPLPGFDEQGCSAAIIICQVTGPTGTVEFSGLALRPHDNISTQIYPMARGDQVSSTSPSLGDKLRETKKHRTSTPASVLDHTYDLARNPAAACALLPEAEKCICIAQKKYDECIRAAGASAADCYAGVILAHLITLAMCGGATITVPIIGGVSCALLVATSLAAAILVCMSIHYSAIDGCMNNFMIDMEGCGWHWVWT